MNAARLCVLAAGRGSRSSFSATAHKCLYPQDKRPTISRLLDSFPDEDSVVVALAPGETLLPRVLRWLHPNKFFQFVTIDPDSKFGHGPGSSLLQCLHLLDHSFVFTACDAHFAGQRVDLVNFDWIGTSRPTSMTDQYVRVRQYANQVYELVEPPIPPDKQHLPIFNGIASISDRDQFKLGLTAAKKGSEREVIGGLQSVLPLRAIEFPNWTDVGSVVDLTSKPGQALYIHDQTVLKIFPTSSEASDFGSRAGSFRDAAPTILGIEDRMVAYEYCAGPLLAETITPERVPDVINCLLRLLTQSNEESESTDLTRFHEASFQFYVKKTLGRLRKLPPETLISLPAETNGVELPPLIPQLAPIFRLVLRSTVPSRFHGDLQLENIVDSQDLRLLDWRTSYGGILDTGDLYYDLGKLHHSFIVTGSSVREEKMSLHQNGADIQVSIQTNQRLLQSLDALEKELASRNLGPDIVRIHSALILLNLASLHPAPYREVAFWIGRMMLSATLTHSWQDFRDMLNAWLPTHPLDE